MTLSYYKRYYILDTKEFPFIHVTPKLDMNFLLRIMNNKIAHDV